MSKVFTNDKGITSGYDGKVAYELQRISKRYHGRVNIAQVKVKMKWNDDEVAYIKVVMTWHNDKVA